MISTAKLKQMSGILFLLSATAWFLTAFLSKRASFAGVGVLNILTGTLFLIAARRVKVQ